MDVGDYAIITYQKVKKYSIRILVRYVYNYQISKYLMWM